MLLDRDPLPWLMSTDNQAITTLVRRDLLGENANVTALWELREPLRLIRRQQPDGSWLYPVKKPQPFNYNLYETFTTLGILVCKFGFDRRHPTIQKGADYVFSCQSPEGDYRGIYGNQPAHTYTPALMDVLIQAGYETILQSSAPFNGFSIRARMTEGGPSLLGRETKGW